MTETPTDPAIPSAEGIVARAGVMPLAKALDLNGDGIPDYQQKWFRDAVAGAMFQIVAIFFPKSPWAMVLKQYEGAITKLIETGTK